MKRKRHTGFTIVELLIVIVVIAILASISIVAFSGIQQRARDSQRKQDLGNIVKLLAIYQSDNGNWVNTGGGASDGTGWFNGGNPTVATTLINAKLTNNIIRDPKCLAGEVIGCSGYIKMNCGSGIAITARLESVPSGAPLPAELSGCSNSGWWGQYSMNYFVKIGS